MSEFPNRNPLDKITISDITIAQSKVPGAKELQAASQLRTKTVNSLNPINTQSDVPLVSLRTALLTILFFQLEAKVAPKILKEKEKEREELWAWGHSTGNFNKSSKPPAEHPRKMEIEHSIMYIVGNLDFAGEEKLAFRDICKGSETDPDYAKKVYVSGLKSAIAHLRPVTYATGHTFQPTTTSETGSWGKKDIAKLTASQIYLLTRAGYSYDQLVEFRKEAFRQATTESQQKTS
ncbi:hypothetical protein A2125_02665 [Candidatus Woesebacteria bacterium GWB1_43_5]|uniref:Uncharacterized protein n=1 Tax=Candidatus Woesebacteria bacterium GWB1_43_5 TaxID=1802474 RepID=A0A1F7WRW3_9BACT|nr:MAG: hypothetical protein A2125_02665 [Candidatus Woesebacteria bacterium GWB1_43_5]